MNLGYSETVAKHQDENSPIARRGNNSQAVVKVIIENIVEQATALFDRVLVGNDRVGRWVIGVGVQKLIESTQGSQPPVDGSDGMALCLSAGDVAVHITDGVCVAAGGLLAQVKKSRRWPA